LRTKVADCKLPEVQMHLVADHVELYGVLVLEKGVLRVQKAEHVHTHDFLQDFQLDAQRVQFLEVVGYKLQEHPEVELVVDLGVLEQSDCGALELGAVFVHKDVPHAAFRSEQQHEDLIRFSALCLLFEHIQQHHHAELVADQLVEVQHHECQHRVGLLGAASALPP